MLSTVALLWRLLTSQGSLLLLALTSSPLRPPQLWTCSFHLIPAWFTPRVPDSYGTLSCSADLSTLISLDIKFLYVGSDVCLKLPSDSTSQWTPLLSAVAFPLSGRLGDLHPLEYVRAGRTKISHPRFSDGFICECKIRLLFHSSIYGNLVFIRDSFTVANFHIDFAIFCFFSVNFDFRFI